MFHKILCLWFLGNARCENERPVIELLNASHPPNSLYSCDVNFAGSAAPNLTWYYRSDQLIEKEETVTSGLASSLLSFPVTPMDRGKNYRCHLSYDTAKWVHICQPSPPLNIKCKWPSQPPLQPIFLKHTERSVGHREIIFVVLRGWDLEGQKNINFSMIFIVIASINKKSAGVVEKVEDFTETSWNCWMTVLSILFWHVYTLYASCIHCYLNYTNTSRFVQVSTKPLGAHFTKSM